MASIGTTGVLIGFAVLLLLVGSALVAFNGWPGEGGAEDGRSVVVEDGSLTLEGPAQVAADAAPAAAAVAAAPAPGTPAAAAAGSPVAASTVPAAPDGPGGPAGGGDLVQRGGGSVEPGVAPSSGGTVQQPNPASGPTPGPVTGGVERTARDLADEAGQTLGQVDPSLQRGVTDTGKAVEELVRGVVGGRGLSLP